MARKPRRNHRCQKSGVPNVGINPLVADAVRLNTRGQAAVSKSKTGRSQVTAPIFLLVRQVKLPKRLDLARDAERALAAIPGSIVRNWVEDR